MLRRLHAEIQAALTRNGVEMTEVAGGAATDLEGTSKHVKRKQQSAHA